MWTSLTIIALVLLTFGVIWSGIIAPTHATVIRISKGIVRVQKGRLKPQAMERLTEVLKEARVTGGSIAITTEDRVIFSRHIPAAIHQRVRNVLLNDWG